MALDGKVVVVTGAARGMGRAYVEGFLSKGARAFIRPMIDKRSGSVIAVSSGGGIPRPDPDGITSSIAGTSREQPYQSAKAAVTALFGYLAAEVKPHNVAVNIINPASAKTT